MRSHLVPCNGAARSSGRVKVSARKIVRWALACLAVAGSEATQTGHAQVTQDVYVPNSLADTASVIDAAGRQVVGTVAVGSFPVAAAVTPDGRYAYVANYGTGTGSNDSVSVIDTATRQVVGTITVGQSPAALAMAPDGSSVYVANQSSGTISVIGTGSRQVVGTVAVGNLPASVAVSPDGRFAYVANYGSDTVSVIDTVNRRVAGTVAVGSYPSGVAVTPDGKRAYVTAAGGNTVSMIDTATFQVAGTISVGTYPAGVAVTPDGGHAYVTASNDNAVSVIDSAGQRLAGTVAVGNYPGGIAVTPDGQQVYATNFLDNTVSVIDAASQRVIGTISVGAGPTASGNFIGPNLITGTLAVGSDAALGALGFGSFLDFRGGTLQLTGNLFDARTVSLLAGGGTIDTQGFSATLSGSVIGDGALTKTGSGTLTLTGVNAYRGGTIISGGTLVAGSSGALGSGPMQLAGAASILQVPAGVSLSNPVNFAGGGTVTNAGTLNANLLDSGAAAAGPETLINSGTVNGNVRLGTGPNAVTLFIGSRIAGDLNLGPNGASTLVLDGAGNQLLTQAVTRTVSNAGSLIKQGSGTWTVDAALSAPAGANVNSGTLLVNGAFATVGAVNVVNGASLGVGTNGAVTGGQVNVAGGALLEVNGTLSSAQVMIAGDSLGQGTLDGTGVIAGNLVNNGLLLPGAHNPPGASPFSPGTGTLQVNGSYVQGASGNLSIGAASPAAYGQLKVTGTANLNGHLTFSLLNGYVPAAGTTFNVVQANGGVTGRFTSLTRPQGVPLTLQVSPAGVSLLVSPLIPAGAGSGTATDVFIPFPRFARNENELSVANALESVRFSAGMPSDLTNVIGLLTYLSNTNPGQLPSAFDQLSPLAVPSFSTIAFTLETAQSAQLQQRLAAIRAGRGYELNQQPVPAMTDAGGKASLETGKEVYQPPKMVELAHGERWGAFVSGSGTFAGVDQATDLLGYHFNTGGVTLGLDYRLTPDWALGLYGGYAHTRADFDQNNRLDIDGGKWGLYTTWHRGGFYLNGIVGGGYNGYDLRRGIDFVSRTARSSPEAWEFDALGGAGYDWRWGALTAGLNASWQYVHLDVHGFTETGAGSLDLQVSQNHADSLRQYLGAHASYAWRLTPNVTIIPEADLAWQHEYLDGGRQIDAAFAGGAGPGFVISRGRAPADSAFGGTGVTVSYKNVSGYFFYNPEFGSGDLVSHTISGGVRVVF